jgi:enamine deaminase RidA (YjgF/YER057c/UK114 family)
MPEPVGLYSHAVEVPAGSRILFISGQLGISPDGVLGSSIEEQADLAWKNVKLVLEAADMTLEDLVKVNTYIVDERHADVVRSVRRKYLPAEQPASTLVAVRAMARTEWLLELEAVAAK